MLKVVGTIFLKDNKLLIDKPRTKPTHQMIGGKVEEKETPLQAAIRECYEELGPKAIFDESKFEQVMDFDEIATSDPNLKIHFYVFKYNGILEGTLESSEEIESFLWYDTSIKEDILSNTLKHKVIPYCIENNLIK